MQLLGIHHLTAVTADAPANHAFYTRTLGMRLVKRTVNQDDVGAYHLFYADGRATPGTDLTFFDWPMSPERPGTHSIVRTGMRVVDEASLRWWASHLDAHQVRRGEIEMRDGRATLHFEDPEGQRLALVVDDGPGATHHPWSASPVPADHQMRGLGPVTISVPEAEPTDRVLRELLGMRRVREYVPAEAADDVTVQVYEMGEGGPAAELHVAVEPGRPPARLGAGGVHHVAFRIPTMEAYEAWTQRLAASRQPFSGPVDRYYFRSLYLREPNGILFEIATDGPGFDVDEPMERLGENLSLPPFLEPRRREIEAGLKPL